MIWRESHLKLTRGRVGRVAVVGCAFALSVGLHPGPALGAGTLEVPQPEFAPPDDASLLSILYASLDVGTADEAADSFSTNTPAEEIAECMRDAGFQYEPIDELAGDPRWTLSAEDYAAQYGFGIVAQELGTYPREPDPNFDYVNSLSEGQRDAYFSAEQSCRGGDSAEGRERYYNAFNVALEQFRGNVAADEQIVDALGEWRGCMAAAGFDYESPQQMTESFYIAMNSSSSEALEGLGAEEVAVAVANVPCEAEYRAVYREVVAGRFDEFKELLDTAYESGAAPDAQG